MMRKEHITPPQRVLLHKDVKNCQHPFHCRRSDNTVNTRFTVGGTLGIGPPNLS